MSGVHPIPLIFAGTEPSPTPELVLVIGQPGAGARSLNHAILSEHVPTIASVAAEDLAAFHPDFVKLTTWRPLDAPAAIAPQVAEWIGATLDHARTTHRSLQFTTSVSTPAPAIGTAAAFKADRFSTRLVIVATPQHESLLATASRYLNARRLHLPARFTDSAAHDRGFAGAQALGRAVEDAADLDRVSVLDRSGQRLFDATHQDGFSGVAEAIEVAHAAPVSVLEGARWFGELRAITDFARRARELAPPVAEVLVQLHILALTEVLPRMPVPLDSSFAVDQVLRLRSEIDALSRELPDTARSIGPIEEAGPVVSPAPSPGGPSL
jgi:UDP-N-acetylglucosamine kinase